MIVILLLLGRNLPFYSPENFHIHITWETGKKPSNYQITSKRQNVEVIMGVKLSNI